MCFKRFLLTSVFLTFGLGLGVALRAQPIVDEGAWGSCGSDPGKLLLPRGIEVLDGTLYAVDAQIDRISRFSLSGVYQGSWGGGEGTHPGQFNHPTAIRAHDKKFFIADSFNNRIQVFNRSGKVVGQYSFPLGSAPTDVAFDSKNNLYVVLSESNQVAKLSPSGRLLASWGGLGTAPGLFFLPTSIAVDSRDRVLVADTNNQRIQVFNVRGRYMDEWPTAAGPSSIDIDRAGNIFIAAGDDAVLQKFDPSGRELTRWPSSPDFLASPTALAVGDHGDVFVMAASKCRVEHYVDQAGR